MTLWSQPCLSLVMIAAVTVSGCATALHGRSQKMALNVVPPGATVSVYSGTGRVVASGRSPETIEIPRPGADEPYYLVLVSHPGYCPRYAVVERGLSTGAKLNSVLLLGGLIGLGVIWADAQGGGTTAVDDEAFTLSLTSDAQCDD